MATSRGTWLRLEEIHQSKGLAKKAISGHGNCNQPGSIKGLHHFAPPKYYAFARIFIKAIKSLRNKPPTKSLKGKTPSELWEGEAADVSNLRVFGSKVHYQARNPERGKLGQRGQEGIFLRYSDVSKGFRIWSKKKRKVIISRDVKFS